MAAGTNPIFTDSVNVGCVAITAACTKSDGTGTIATDIFKAFTAGADGSFVQKVRFNNVGTVAGTACTATVYRVYISSATSGATTGGTNTFLVGEVSNLAQNTDHATVATYPVEIVVNQVIPANWTVLVSSHAAPAANTGIQAIVVGGDY
jgi:hypothetical protein